MPLSADEASSMRTATREAARVLLDDLQFLRSTFEKLNPTTGDVRRISVILRRLLLDHHLQIVAAPRVGRIRLPIPASEELLKLPGDFVSVGIAPMFQAQTLASYRVFFDNSGNFLTMPDGSPIGGRMVGLSGLMTDKVIRLSGEFATRADVLKFICYHAYGAHFSGKPIAALEILKAARFAIVWSRSPDGMLEMRLGNVGREPPPHLMDLVHAHAFSTGYFLANAPDVLALEAVIERDAGDI